MKQKKVSGPWLSGSFYLCVLVLVIASLAAAGHILSVYALPVVVGGGIIAVSVIGALQLRQDEKLSEKNFLELMTLSLKFLPSIKRQGKSVSTK